jgi:hypothetical protein
MSRKEPEVEPEVESDATFNLPSEHETKCEYDALVKNVFVLPIPAPPRGGARA